MASNKFLLLGGMVVCVFLFSACNDTSKATVATKKRFKEDKQQTTEQPQDASEVFYEEEKKEKEEVKYPELRNPFLSIEEEKNIKDQTDMIPLKTRNVSAILYAPPRSTAIIDGKIAQVGDMIDDKKIIEIQAEQVILEDAQSKYYLKINELAPGS